MTTFETKTYAGHAFEVVDTRTYEYGTYEFEDELDIKAAYWSDFAPGETVIDIGASWGGYTLPALACGVKVIAIEPSDRGFEVLIDAVAKNGWAYRCLALKDVLFDGGPTPSWFTERICRDFFIRTQSTMTLDAIVADAIAAGFCERIDRIKMDVEGMEVGILRGAADTLQRFRPLLVIEDHTNQDYPELRTVDRDCIAILRMAGYERIEQIRPPRGNAFIIARPA